MNIRPYSVGLLPNREVKVIYEYSTDVLRVLCSEHMGKTNLTILAAVADRPSVWPPQPTASNYILLAIEIYPMWVIVWICKVVTKMALEGDQVGLENLFVDQSDTTVTFPNCPDVATEFFQPQRTSTKKAW